MTNINRDPLLRAIYDAAQAVEACGASEALTAAVMAVTAIYQHAERVLDERDAAIARADTLAAQFDRLPPYDEEGFYIDHGQWGRESVSVADVMDSLRGALAAIDAARAEE